MKKEPFRGSGVAIITPFDQDQKVDYDAYARLLARQIAQHTDAIVVCGTTGESATLSDREFSELVAFTVRETDHRVPVIAGTGSNDTMHALKRSQWAESLGADGLLLVTPYYNKTTQQGLVEHFTYIADRVNLPILLYNVPSRTGMRIEADTYARLSAHPNIVGAKEATGDFSHILRTRALCPPDFYLYSGNDDQTLPILALGGVGIISVLANVCPAPVHALCRHWFDGETAQALAVQLKYQALCDALFSETNPIPVKAALEYMGLCGGALRLPLVPMREDKRAGLIRALEQVL